MKTAAYELLRGFPGAYVPTAPAEAEDGSSLPFGDVPQSWASIVIGSLVLAASGDDSGAWYEAVVIETKADELLLLRWRDWPDHDPFLRRPGVLALLPAAA